MALIVSPVLLWMVMDPSTFQHDPCGIVSVELSGWLLIQVCSVAVLSVFVKQVDVGADDVTAAVGSVDALVTNEASTIASTVIATMPLRFK